ncbi:MAG: hypothetical protein H8D22_00960 [Candidatus Cloacimonetes bacterium]|nr:hypothetical protein [Candidatus Cloacimonadota bacterium]
MSEKLNKLWEYKTEILTTIIVGLTGFILGLFLFKEEIFGSWSAYSALLFTITWSLLCVFILLFLKSKRESTESFKDFTIKINNLDKKINNVNIDFKKYQESILEKLERMIEQSALFSDKNQLEKTVIDLLRRKTEGILWIVAKFVSKQVSKNFSTLEFPIDGSEYSEFSKMLYPECKKAIYLTSPFTPIEWLRELVEDNKHDIIDDQKEKSAFKRDTADDILNRINNGESLKDIIDNSPEINIPHINALNSTDSNVIKKRLVILQHGYDYSLIAQEKLLMEFINITPEVKTKFIEINTLKKYRYLKEFISSDDYDFMKYDYAIFDNEVLLKWKRPEFEKDTQPLTLFDLKKETTEEKTKEQIINDIFENNIWKDFKSDSYILNYIKEKKKELFEEVKRTAIIPHKLAYYCNGAKTWQNIVNRPYDYVLGSKESKTLDRFLSNSDIETEIKSIISSNNSKCNITLMGPGDGKEIEKIVNYFEPLKINKFCLLDISPELLNVALLKGIRLHMGLNILTSVKDIISEDFNDLPLDKNIPNFIFVIANGAILSNNSVYEKIYNSMTKKDRLIIIVESFKEFNESAKNMIINEYSQENENIGKLFIEPLKLIGIDVTEPKEYLNSDFITQEDLDLYVENFMLKKWKDDNNIKDYNGFKDKIRVFASLKTTPEKLKHLLEKKRFNVKNNHSKYFEEENCCGVLCRKN